jgi:hypothetical protein
MRENGASAAKKYEWDGQPVSRSTYFRMKRKNKRRERAKPLRRGAISSIIGRADSEQAFVRDERIDRERVETFMWIAANASVGEQDECVQVTLPRKILTATLLTLKGQGF